MINPGVKIVSQIPDDILNNSELNSAITQVWFSIHGKIILLTSTTAQISKPT